MRPSVLAWTCLLLILRPVFASDSITLNNGEAIHGEIVSESETQIVVEEANYNRTITSQRPISRSDIRAVQRESAQQKQKRQAYEALGRLQLDPDHEFTKAEYDRGINTFDQYLAAHPGSPFAGDIRQRMAVWRQELSHVDQGEVKFHNRWMTPDEKAPLVDQFIKQQRVDLALTALQSLTDRLGELQRQRRQLAAELASLQQSLQNAQRTVNELTTNPPTIRIPQYRTVPGTPAYSVVNNAGGVTPVRATAPTTIRVEDRIVPDTERIDKARQELAVWRSRVSQKRQALSAASGAMLEMQQRIDKTESDYNLAFAQLQEQSPPTPAESTVVTQQVVVAAPPIVVTQRVAAVQLPASGQPGPESWLVTNWQWLVGGGFGAMLVIAFLVRRGIAQRGNL